MLSEFEAILRKVLSLVNYVLHSSLLAQTAPYQKKTFQIESVIETC